MGLSEEKKEEDMLNGENCMSFLEIRISVCSQEAPGSLAGLDDFDCGYDVITSPSLSRAQRGWASLSLSRAATMPRPSGSPGRKSLRSISRWLPRSTL